MKLNHKGFTLIELMVVIVILGIVGVALVPAVYQHISKSEQQTNDMTCQEFRAYINTRVKELPSASEYLFEHDIYAYVSSTGCGYKEKISGAYVATTELLPASLSLLLRDWSKLLKDTDDVYMVRLRDNTDLHYTE